MAKNISKNQWFKDIKDNVYVNTAILNNILLISVNTTTAEAVPASTSIATLRNPELFRTAADGTITNYQGQGVRVVNGILQTITQVYSNSIGFTTLQLKSKQLETDFYSPEQLAEMYPDDPAYQVATADLLDDDIPDKVKSEPTIEPPVSGTEPTIASEVSNNDEPS